MRRTPALVVPIIFLSGCAGSLDPAPDIQRADDLTAQRTGIVPDWKTQSCVLWDGTTDLTADEAVRYAVSGHREVRASLERIAASRADLVQSGLLPNPVLNVGLAFQFAGTPADTSLGISLTQSLVALLQRDDRMKAADADLEHQILATSDLALAIAAKARAAHARAYYAQKQVLEQQAAVANAERSVGAARKRFDAGEATSLHVNRQRLLLLRLTAQLARRETDLATRKRELAAAVCRADAPMNWSAAEPASAAPAFDPATIDEDRVIELALEQRLDAAAADATARAALMRAGIEADWRWLAGEDLQAGVGYQHTDDGADEIGPTLTVPIPIFDTGDARTAKARAEARQAVLMAQDIREQAILEARLALIASRSAAMLAANYDTEIVALAHENLQLAQQSFNAGESDLTVLLEAEEALVSARSDLIELQEQAALARIELERAVGGRLTPDSLLPAAAAEPAAPVKEAEQPSGGGQNNDPHK